jgi:uncharacterized membrane protein
MKIIYAMEASKMKNSRFIAEAAIIAAMYAVLTILLAPISYGPFQLRISEALTILPFFTPAAIPGLFIGCVIANTYSFILFGGVAVLDIVFGSLATLAAAFISLKVPKKHLVPLPPIIINGVVVGFILNYMLHVPLFITMMWVALGEAAACYGIGYPLMLVLEKHRHKIFKR